MSQMSLTQLDMSAFLTLASQCGLELEEVDLVQLDRRKLVVPWQFDKGESCYTEFHLYAVAQYLNAVRPIRHPWTSRAPELTLDEVSRIAGQVNRLLDVACGESGEERRFSAELEELVMGVERFLARIDPFGALADAFDFLQPSLRGSVRNSGRLYLELKLAASHLTAQLEADGEGAPLTKPMFGIEATEMAPIDDLRSTQVMDQPVTGASARKAIDDVLSAASEASDAEIVEEDPRSTQVIQVMLNPEPGLVEDSSEPIVLLDEEIDEDDLDGEDEETASKGKDFKSHAETTGRNQDLNKRLERLRENDTAAARERRTVKESPSQGISAQDSKTTAERIAELNRRREAYLREQKWEELVALYEDGIELFSIPAEREQVFLVLAMLQEAKLRQKGRAFEAFTRALAEGQEGPGRKKALEGLRRLAGDVDRGQQTEFIERALEGELEESTRALFEEFTTPAAD